MMSWKNLLKVQITNTKQDIKTSKRALPEPEDNKCKDIFIKWLEKATYIYDRYNKQMSSDAGGNWHNKSQFDKISESTFCKMVEHVKEQDKTLVNTASSYRTHWRMGENEDGDDLQLMCGPGIIKNRKIYFDLTITNTTKWLEIYNASVVLPFNYFIEMNKNGLPTQEIESIAGMVSDEDKELNNNARQIIFQWGNKHINPRR